VGCVTLTKASGFIAALALACAFPSAAAAADRFAEPGGDGAEPCAQSDPCDIATAVNDANQGDDITLLPGTYTPIVTLGIDLSSGFDPKFNLTIHGAPGARPVVNFSSSSASAFYITTGSSLRDVDVNVTGNSASAVGALNGGTLERVNAHASGTDGAACSVTNQSTVRDSVCWYSGSGGPNAAAVSSASDFASSTAVNTVRNVTAIAAAGPGLRARSVSSVNAGVTVNATNVIARGGGGVGGEDVRTERLTGTGDTPPQTINLDHSNYVTEHEQDTGDITDPGTGTNVTTAPAFVNAAIGDFHQLDISTGTLDLGTATGMDPQERDIDGDFRALGIAPDIGADERQVVPPAPSITSSDPPSGSNENNPLLIGTAEPLSFVHVFASPDCTGPEAGAELAEEFASPGIIVSVPDDSTTTFSANAVNDAGTSTCSAPFTYREVTTPPSQPPPAVTPPQPLPQTPATTPKKKCKKGFVKKKVKGKKKCVKKKKRK
jgi:hypothetical protein